MKFQAYESAKESIYTDPRNDKAPICYYSKVSKFSRVRSSQSSPYMEIYNAADFPGARCSYHLSEDKSIDVVSSIDKEGDTYTRADFYDDKKYGNGIELRIDKFGIINYDTRTMLFYDGYKFYVKKITNVGKVIDEVSLDGFYPSAFNNFELVYFNKADECDGALEPFNSGCDYFETRYGNGFGFSLNQWDECFRIGCAGSYQKFDSTCMWLQDGKAHVGNYSHGAPAKETAFALDKNLRMFSVGKLSDSGLYMKGLVAEVTPTKAKIYSNRDMYGAAKNSYLLEWDAEANKATMFYIDSDGNQTVECEATL